jgi:hypothetical protein
MATPRCAIKKTGSSIDLKHELFQSSMDIDLLVSPTQSKVGDPIVVAVELKFRRKRLRDFERNEATCILAKIGESQSTERQSA